MGTTTGLNLFALAFIAVAALCFMLWAVARHTWVRALASASVMFFAAHQLLNTYAAQIYIDELRPHVTFGDIYDQANKPAPADAWSSVLPTVAYDVLLYVAITLAVMAMIATFWVNQDAINRTLAQGRNQLMTYFGFAKPTPVSNPTRHLAGTKHEAANPNPYYNPPSNFGHNGGANSYK